MGETPLQISSFDDFIKRDQEESTNKEQESLETRLSNERLEWSSKIEVMGKKMKNVLGLTELMVEVYTERQRAVEYYHYLISITSRLSKSYRKQWAQKYDHYTYNSQKRFPNEKSKELHILSEISEVVSKREAIDNHSKFIDNTIKTIDNIIYGIKYRIEIEQISRGN